MLGFLTIRAWIQWFVFYNPFSPLYLAQLGHKFTPRYVSPLSVSHMDTLSYVHGSLWSRLKRSYVVQIGAKTSGLQMTPPSLPGTENPGKHGSPDFILIMKGQLFCLLPFETCIVLRGYNERWHTQLVWRERQSNSRTRRPMYAVRTFDVSNNGQPITNWVKFQNAYGKEL